MLRAPPLPAVRVDGSEASRGQAASFHAHAQRAEAGGEAGADATEQEKLKKLLARRNDDAAIMSARERYLQRKAERRK